MNNSTNSLNIPKNSIMLMMLIAKNLNQAIKCCAIIDAYNVVKNDLRYKNNELYEELIDCTYRDLLMSIGRIYDENSTCNINEYKTALKVESKLMYSEEEKAEICKRFKPLQKEYKSKYKIDRNKRLAHTDYDHILGRYRDKYEYDQIRELVIKTKEVFDYILSLYNDTIPFVDINDSRNKYLSLFKK